MNFNEFVNEVKDNIKLFLPKDYENAEVSTIECQKLNRAYTGLMVRKEGEMLTPTINLNQLYEAYKAQPGVTMETVCRKIADIVIETPIQIDLKSILKVKKRITRSSRRKLISNFSITCGSALNSIN